MSTLAFPTFVDPRLEENFVRDGYVFDLYDGDTVYYHVDLGYDVWGCFLTGRLLDINAPELKPLVSREQGQAAKDGLNALLGRYALNRHLSRREFGWKFRIKSLPAADRHVAERRVMKKGKYGRWLVVLLGADDNGQTVNLNNLMLQEGLAVPYWE